MDNRSIISKYFRYVILAFFVIILSITFIRFDVNIISDLFYNLVINLNSNKKSCDYFSTGPSALIQSPIPPTFFTFL